MSTAESFDLSQLGNNGSGPEMMIVMQFVGQLSATLETITSHLAFQSAALAALVGQTNPQTGEPIPGIMQEHLTLLRDMQSSLQASAAAIEKVSGNPLALLRGKKD